MERGSTPDMLARVRKLLALAGSPNVHEAASAAAAAQALIERHRLQAHLEAEQSADAEPITDGREAPLEVTRRLRRWKLVLASELAGVNGCIAWTLEQEGQTHLLLAGREADRQAVMALWSWLLPRIEWLSATHGPGRSRQWHESFRIGAAEAIATALAGVHAAISGEASPVALARIEPVARARAAALESFAASHLRLGRGRNILVDPRALQRGRTAAASLPLPRRKHDDDD